MAAADRDKNPYLGLLLPSGLITSNVFSIITVAWHSRAVVTGPGIVLRVSPTLSLVGIDRYIFLKNMDDPQTLTVVFCMICIFLNVDARAKRGC